MTVLCFETNQIKQKHGSGYDLLFRAHREPLFGEKRWQRKRNGPHLRAVSVNWKVAEAGIPTVKREPLSGKSGRLENDKQSGTAEKIQNLRL